jgi:hypothetical protein
VTSVRRDDLIEGVKRSIANGRDYFETALLATDANLRGPAATNYAHALQEIGKAQILGVAHAAGLTQPSSDLRDHNTKFTAAEVALGSSAMWLRNPAFQPDAFQNDAFDVGVPANEATRRKVGYVDYGSTGWQLPPEVSLTDLRGNITDALALLPQIEFKLTGGKKP